MNEAGDNALRFDGLYYRVSGRITSFLRFFPDGSVIGTSIARSRTSPYAGALRRWWHREKSPPALDPQAMAAKMASWFNAQWSGERGTYQLQGTQLEFFTTSSAGRVDHRGTIGVDSLLLDSHNQALGHRTAKFTYRYAPFKP